MKIQTQKQFDEINSDYKGYIFIEDTTEWLVINRSFDNAYIYVRDNATIQCVYNNATIQYVRDNATIRCVGDNATIQDVGGNATIQDVRDNATILLLTMFATITALHSAKKVIAKGNSIIRCFDKNIDIEKTKGVTVIYQDEKLIKENSVKELCELFPVEKKGTKLILYKAVHKIDGKYIADYDKATEYKLGINEATEFDDNTQISCTKGIHVSYLGWAERFGLGWEDLAILECEVNPKDIIVADDCDGKVRAKKINIIKEI